MKLMMRNKHLSLNSIKKKKKIIRRKNYNNFNSIKKDKKEINNTKCGKKKVLLTIIYYFK
jgi:hypothetical protein